MRGIAATASVVLYWTSVLVWGLLGLLPAGITHITSESAANAWLVAGLLLLVIGVCSLAVKNLRVLFRYLADRRKSKAIADYEKSARIPPRL